MNTTRRGFIKHSAIAGAALGVAPSILNACNSPSDKITLALIGCRSQGYANLDLLLNQENVECLALCDVDKNILEATAAKVEKKVGSRPALESDFRKVLENKDINTVIIGTPDHWHAIIMMTALQAGKHVYVEKPMGHSINECYAMMDAQKKFPELKVQVGMWQRSSKHWHEAVEIVQSGLIGDVHLAKAWIYKGYDNPYPYKEDSVTPDYVDYDMWLGPAPKKPFNVNRFHYNHRWWWDYAGGAMTDWGVHLLDFALLGMGAEKPNSISPGGGIYYHEKGVIETPDIQQAIYSYPDFTLMWECGLNPGIGPYGKHHGVAFIGQKGTLVVDRSGYQLLPDMNNSKREPYFEKRKQATYDHGADLHMKNFLDSIRKGKKLNADVVVGGNTCIVAEMGNIAYRVGEKIEWNNNNLSFNNAHANRLMSLEYRDPWSLPEL